MNRDDIIRMAEEASGGRQPDGWGVMLDHEQLDRFAGLVAAAEREACAKVCEEHIAWNLDDPGSTAAKAIRARMVMINGMTEKETSETMSVRGMK